MDELNCRFNNHDIPKNFWCFEGSGQRALPRDCLARERVGAETGLGSSSVSETEEWVCAKLISNNGSVARLVKFSNLPPFSG